MNIWSLKRPIKYRQKSVTDYYRTVVRMILDKKSKRCQEGVYEQK